jgi:propanol-preferring alcohol dehydrogenase
MHTARVRALRFNPDERNLRIEDVEVREPRGDEVLVRVAGAGLCGSDLHIVDGEFAHFVRKPVTLGHEVAGVVEAIGRDVRELGLGESVAVMVGWGCGHCEWCVSGHEQLCLRGDMAGATCDGAFAEFMLVPHRRHVGPLGDLDALEASPFGCAALSAFAAVSRVAPYVDAGQTVAVIGIGGLGEFALQFLGQLTGAQVVAVDVREPARARSLSLGAAQAVEPKHASEAVVDIGGGRGASAVIDLVGSGDSLALAASLVARRGIVALLGVGGGTLPLGYWTMAPEASLTTVLAGPVSDLQHVVRLAQQGAIASRVQTYPLEDAQRAIAELRAGSVEGRAVLVPS